MSETLLSALILAGGLLKSTLPLMILGVIAAELIVTLGFVNKLSFIARPITSFSHLQPECGTSFLVAFGSPVAANAMLAQYHEKGMLSKKEMFLASLLNSFPSVLLHWRSMLPPLIPLLGTIGLIYFLLFVLTGLVKTTLLMIASRFLLPARPAPKLSLETKPRPPLKEAFKQSLKSSWKVSRRMIAITVPTMLVVSILIEVGVFNSLASYLGGVSAFLPIPISGIGIIVSMFGHPIAAYTVASNLVAVGEISAKGVVLSLLIGGIFANAVFLLRSSIPNYMGIFGLKTGVQITLLSSAIWNSIIIILIVILAIFWQ
ncbi:MAG: nucleoside recognition protein [Chloroflexota bacterium]